jgi:hypothetical protein
MVEVQNENRSNTKEFQKMMHLLKFHGHHNIPMSKVSSFLETLEKFFDENYVDVNNIHATFFQMQGKTKK